MRFLNAALCIGAALCLFACADVKKEDESKSSPLIVQKDNDPDGDGLTENDPNPFKADLPKISNLKKAKVEIQIELKGESDFEIDETLSLKIESIWEKRLKEAIRDYYFSNNLENLNQHIKYNYQYILKKDPLEDLILRHRLSEFNFFKIKEIGRFSFESTIKVENLKGNEIRELNYNLISDNQILLKDQAKQGNISVSMTNDGGYNYFLKSSEINANNLFNLLNSKWDLRLSLVDYKLKREKLINFKDLYKNIRSKTIQVNLIDESGTQFFNYALRKGKPLKEILKELFNEQVKFKGDEIISLKGKISDLPLGLSLRDLKENTKSRFFIVSNKRTLGINAKYYPGDIVNIVLMSGEDLHKISKKIRIHEFERLIDKSSPSTLGAIKKEESVKLVVSGIKRLGSEEGTRKSKTTGLCGGSGNGQFFGRFLENLEEKLIISEEILEDLKFKINGSEIPFYEIVESISGSSNIFTLSLNSEYFNQDFNFLEISAGTRGSIFNKGFYHASHMGSHRDHLVREYMGVGSDLAIGFNVLKVSALIIKGDINE